MFFYNSPIKLLKYEIQDFASNSKNKIKPIEGDINEVFTLLPGNYRGRLSIYEVLVPSKYVYDRDILWRNTGIVYLDGKLCYTVVDVHGVEFTYLSTGESGTNWTKLENTLQSGTKDQLLCEFLRNNGKIARELNARLNACSMLLPGLFNRSQFHLCFSEEIKRIFRV